MIVPIRHLWGTPLILGLISALALAQPHLSGNLSGNLGPGTYIVDGHCTIPSGSTLTIAPSTIFLHSGNFAWFVHGVLHANGAVNDSIKFVRQFPTPECRWGGIRFLEDSSPASNLTYCVIDYGYQTTASLYPLGGGIYVNMVGITINHTRISNCEGADHGGGIYAFMADVHVDHCLIVNNLAPNEGNGGGVYLMACTAAQITNCVITFNRDNGT